MTIFATAARADCTAEPAVPTPPPAPAHGYVLVKNWDFCRSVRNEYQLRNEFFTRYVYANGKLDFLNDEWQRYRDNNNHVFGPDGLSLVARLKADEMRPGTIESGMLRSRWTGKYGYFEARVQVPAARGAWPAFWLNPQDQKWPPEIDIFEIVNNGRDTPARSFHFLHNGDKSRPQPSFSLMGREKFYQPPTSYADGFHTFAVLWTPTEVTHYVDGARILASPFNWAHADGSDGGSAHVLINLAIGGRWPGAPLSTTDFPMRLVVSFMRVWQAPPDGSNAPQSGSK